MSRALLCITGAQFYPTKGSPLEQITIKFLLKCLQQKDEIARSILQVEYLPHNPFNSHIRIAKEFLQYANGLDCCLSRTPLTMFNKEQLIYDKDKILEHTCRKWDSILKDKFPYVRRNDPYNLGLFYGQSLVPFRPATDPFGSVSDMNGPQTGPPPELSKRTPPDPIQTPTDPALDFQVQSDPLWVR